MDGIKLYQENKTYKDKDGNEKNATNFYLQCGNTLVPIEVKFFANKETGKDVQFAGRKAVLRAYAEMLPEKQAK